MTVELEGKVRAHSREESWEAAGRQTKSKTEAVKATILTLLRRHGGMTHEELVDRYEASAWLDESIPKVTPQSVRSRAHELFVEAKITDAGRRGRTRTGNTATVWEVT
ncbi:hypothetical protein ITJ66_05925 [Plantibacter sp. VKM Ac-2885]|uniref:hypothetical protein n=1 Tax=Plantibacter sp. VKM Ac-2885 TaxID=2783828 RepID=UPI00188A2375|nr:hypothetical protein [Plantibacter sp. VKM Ac-2885]MBF4512023.1 hypothetical protein [Plantibacter sp. VKM Ac-2885]